MATNLDTVLSEVKKNTKQLVLLNKKVGSLERDMKKVLKCVSTENANFKVKPMRSNSSGSRSQISIAAKSR